MYTNKLWLGNNLTVLYQRVFCCVFYYRVEEGGLIVERLLSENRETEGRL